VSNNNPFNPGIPIQFRCTTLWIAEGKNASALDPSLVSSFLVTPAFKNPPNDPPPAPGFHNSSFNVLSTQYEFVHKEEEKEEHDKHRSFEAQ
jgi:hypothetical protein